MATKIVEEHTCDDCEEAHLDDVHAHHHHVLSLDGGPYRQLDFCSPSERAVMERLIHLYHEHGRDLERPQQTPPVTEPPAALEEERQAIEKAPPAPADDTRPPKKPAKTKAPKAVQPPLEAPPMQVWCPLPHGPDGQGKFVTYKQRGMHAEKVHGLNVWDVAWKDIHGILEAPCTSHRTCMDNGLMFPNQQGVYTHIAKCPLPRIDTENQPEPGEEARE